MEIIPEYSLKGLMLKLQYFGHLMGRTDSFEETLMLGKIEGGRYNLLACLGFTEKEEDGYKHYPEPKKLGYKKSTHCTILFV